MSPISIRLVGGSHPADHEGRVEVYINKVWGTIDYNSLDMRDANVVCRTLGYQFALKMGRASSLGFGSGTGPFWFWYLNCDGSERSIAECYVDTPDLYSNHTHSNDAAVVCSEFEGWCSYAYI